MDQNNWFETAWERWVQAEKDALRLLPSQPEDIFITQARLLIGVVDDIFLKMWTAKLTYEAQKQPKAISIYACFVLSDNQISENVQLICSEFKSYILNRYGNMNL